MTTSIAGLLPGVEMVRIGTAGPEEFEQVGDSLLKGPRGMSSVIVKPADGWSFVFDIKANVYRPVATLASRKIFLIQFEATTKTDLDHLEAIKRMPGVTGVKDVTDEAVPITPETTPPAGAD